MKAIRLIAVLAFCWAISIQAFSSILDEVWSSRSEKDEFTNEMTYTATGDSGGFFTFAGKTSFSRRDGYDFGVRCDVAQDGEKDFMLTFTVGSSLATPSSRAYLYTKVDDNAPIELIGKLFSNSYRSGYVLMNSTNQEKIEKLVAQGIAGNKLTVRVHDERRSEIEDYFVMLKGFTKHTAKAVNACGVGRREHSLTDADRGRLEEIDQLIRKLEREKSEILSKG